MHGIKGIGTIMILMLAMSTAFSAQESSVLLEKAIYAEETLGNLTDAIRIYQQIVQAADVNRTTGALALYRLGMCYRKSGNEEEARAAFTRLAQQYPEQKDLIAKSQMLNLRPAPWTDGEVLRMGTKSSGAKSDMGAYVYSAESIQEAGKPAWNFRNVMVTSGMSIYQAAVVDAGSYTPISGRMRVSFMLMDNEARYTQNQVDVSSLQNGVKASRQIPLSGVVYDSAQILHLVRCLPLREGFQTTISVFNPTAGTTVNLKVAVVGRETITVPAGTFDCLKTSLTPEGNAQDQTVWLSTEGHFYPVKLVQGGILEQELHSIEVVGKTQMVRFEDKESGINMSMPPQWYFGRTVLGGLVSLAAPELDSLLLLYSWERKPEDPALAKFVDNWISKHQQLPQTYQVREGTREAATIAGLEAERYIADTRHASTGEAMVEYTYSFVTPAKKYVFVFQTSKDNFDNMKPAFESITASVGIR